MQTAFFFLIGVALLVFGADRLVAGASSLARRFGISQLVVGLTVVALGTSAPELAVSVASVLNGNTDIALGNVVGSNICNLLLILGLTAAITPLAVLPRIVRFDVPVMITASIVVILVSLDGVISIFDGLLFLLGMVIYIWHSVREGRKAGATEATSEAVVVTLPKALFFVGLGLVALVLGSRWMLESAVQIAAFLGLSQAVIGLTVVAVGTSLPEIATSILAARRGETDLSVGNLVGSNILNILAILGASSVFASDGIPVPELMLRADIPLMIGVALLSWPLVWTHSAVTRKDGAVLLVGYALYTTYLLLQARNHPGLSQLYLLVLAYLVGVAIVIGGGVLAHIRKKKVATETVL